MAAGRAGQRFGFLRLALCWCVEPAAIERTRRRSPNVTSLFFLLHYVSGPSADPRPDGQTSSSRKETKRHVTTRGGEYKSGVPPRIVMERESVLTFLFSIPSHLILDSKYLVEHVVVSPYHHPVNQKNSWIDILNERTSFWPLESRLQCGVANLL